MGPQAADNKSDPLSGTAAFLEKKNVINGYTRPREALQNKSSKCCILFLIFNLSFVRVILYYFSFQKLHSLILNAW